MPADMLKEWLKSYGWLAGPCLAAGWILHSLGHRRIAWLLFAIGGCVVVVGLISMVIPAVRWGPPVVAHFRKRWYWYLAVLPFVALGAYVIYDLVYFGIIGPRLADMNLIWRQSNHKHDSGLDDFTFAFTLANKTGYPMYLNEVLFSLSPAYESVAPPPIRAARVSHFSDKVTARLFLEGGSPQIETLAKRKTKMECPTNSGGQLIFGVDRILFDPREEVDFKLKLTVLEPPDDVLRNTRDLRVQLILGFNYEDASASKHLITAFSILGIGPQWKDEKVIAKPAVSYK